MLNQKISDIKNFKLEDAPLQKIDDPLILSSGINLYIKREDLIHPALSGNKWYKLKYNLIDAAEKNFNSLLSFGGAFSNHIYALASAGKIFGFKTTGIIRGEEHLPLNPTLKFAVNNGMELHYISRSEYRKKNDSEFLKKINEKFGDVYVLPEGGSNTLAVKGTAEILSGITVPFDYICLPCGTGGTIAGIISALNEIQFALGFSVLKGGTFLKDNVSHFLSEAEVKRKINWDINLDYHFGGYAKYNSQLLDFIRRFESTNNIQIEPIYTAKMLYGIYNLIHKNYFKPGSTIIAIHTGGLQGFNRSILLKPNRFRW